ncbi:MAG: hypothetical protein EXR72_20440 [Myxococcales bacterium]|nr:hypothetical protein [Myxococcales bacterium]
MTASPMAPNLIPPLAGPARYAVAMSLASAGLPALSLLVAATVGCRTGAVDGPVDAGTAVARDLASVNLDWDAFLNECGNTDPNCTDVPLGPAASRPFPLPTDQQRDPNAAAEGVLRDGDGNLVLSGSAGSWSYIFRGCLGNDSFPSGDTRWRYVSWTAQIPVGTSIRVRARSGSTPTPGNKWGAWTQSVAASPADFSDPKTLVPSFHDDGFLQVEFALEAAKPASPTLKAVHVVFDCFSPPPGAGTPPPGARGR